jgi:two-component system, OmpR family, alkaline phosphatase synthesis response regulator PhoP
MRRHHRTFFLKKRKITVSGDISLNSEALEIYKAGQSISVTVTEFKLMQIFLCKPNVVFSRGDLISAVWGKHHASTTRTIDNNIASLRQKFDQSGEPSIIKTVHGIGYKFIPRATN